MKSFPYAPYITHYITRFTILVESNLYVLQGRMEKSTPGTIHISRFSASDGSREARRESKCSKI
jgi:hypothetical protein